MHDSELTAVSSAFDSTINSLTTADVTEDSSNKYYTDVRVKSKLTAEDVVSGSNSDVKTFLGISASDISDVDAFSQSGTYASLRAQSTTAADVDLGNVTNESKATMFTSPAFTTNPTAPTQTNTDDSTKLATTQFVQARITDIIGNAGSTLDTLGELSASLAEDSGSLSTLTTVVGTKLVKASNLSDLTNAGTARTNLGVDAAGTVNYVLPTNLAGDDIDIDTTPLTGATVISDLDINITTNTSGLVTDANGSVSTRTLTATDLSLGNVTNESKATMFTSPTFTGTVGGTTDFGGNISITGSLNVKGDIMPSAENLYDIGSAAMRWEDMWADQVYGRSVYVDDYIYHNGDANTYIQFQADRQTFVASGSEFIDFKETAQPYITLGNGNDTDTRMQGGAGYIFIQGSDGYIGINDATPSYPLEINAITYIGSTLEVSSTVKSSTYLVNRATAAGIGTTLGDINGIELGPGYLTLARDDTANAKQLSFYKNNAEHSYLETTSTGLNIGGANVGFTNNVNIGNWTPGNASRVAIRGTGTYNNTMSRSGATLQIISDELSNDAWSPVFNIGIVRQSLTTGKDSFGGIGFTTIDDSNNSGVFDAARIALINEQPAAVLTPTALGFYTNSSPSADDTAATEKMRIASDGNVAIGTDTPDMNGWGANHTILGISTPTAGKSSQLNLRGNSDETADVMVGTIGFLDSTGTGAGATVANITVKSATATASRPGSYMGFYTNEGAVASTPSQERLRIQNTGILQKRGDSTTARILPETDNVGYIGEASTRWNAIYAGNGTIQTSDIREKTEIKPTQLGLNFVNDLNPVSYKWINNERPDSTKDERFHQGLIAQEVVKTLEKHGVDKNKFGGLDIQKTDKYEDFHGMSYEQLVAPMIKAIQEQQTLIESQKSLIDNLTSRIETLEG